MRKKDLKNKTILLTGATGGFGQEFTRQLLAMGAHLILSGRDTAKLRSMADAYKNTSPDGRIIGLIDADLSARKGCEDLYNRCLGLTPDIDILINNAGIIAYGNFHEVPEDTWERLVETNLLSTMRLTYLFLPGMLKRRQGHIVIMSSVAGFVGSTQSSAYSASKFGMRGFGLSLSGEVRKQGIDVTILCPFWADTPILQSHDYGTVPTRKVIGLVVDRADSVVRESIRGIRKRKLSVYPGPTAKVLSFANRFVQIIGSQGKG